jgi:quinol monooxygenase YgiN
MRLIIIGSAALKNTIKCEEAIGMVVVTFKLLGKPEKLTEIRQSLNEIAVKVKKLDGCRDTKVYLDMNDENLFFMVEEWQNKRHLDDHMKSSLFSAILGIKGLLTKEPEIMFMNEG